MEDSTGASALTILFCRSAVLLSLHSLPRQVGKLHRSAQHRWHAHCRVLVLATRAPLLEFKPEMQNCRPISFEQETLLVQRTDTSQHSGLFMSI